MFVDLHVLLQQYCCRLIDAYATATTAQVVMRGEVVADMTYKFRRGCI